MSDNRSGHGAEDGNAVPDLARLAVAVSVYRPDMALLDRLLASLAALPMPILVHVDGPAGEAIGAADLARLAADSRLRISQFETNRGIAAALNAMGTQAAALGCDAILFFDQDSEPASDLPERLLAALAKLEARGHRPAAVGPRPTARDPARSKAPHYRRRREPAAEGDLFPVDFLITSGSLMRLAVLDRVGPFREDFRIDAVDTEWCFRAWAQGFSVWVDEGLAMPHRVGSGVVRLGPIRFPRQSPSRMETYVRNQARLLRLGHVPLSWKARILAYLPLQVAAYASRAPEAGRGTVRRLARAALEGFRTRP